jgi:osmotically inducible lipoprotein OsmB
MRKIQIFIAMLLTSLILDAGVVRAQENNSQEKEKKGMSKKGKGALIGTGAGAATGAIVGGKKGAVIGAGAGAIGGAVIGRKKDKKKDPDRYKEYSDKEKKD